MNVELRGGSALLMFRLLFKPRTGAIAACSEA